MPDLMEGKIHQMPKGIEYIIRRHWRENKFQSPDKNYQKKKGPAGKYQGIGFRLYIKQKFFNDFGRAKRRSGRHRCRRLCFRHIFLPPAIFIKYNAAPRAFCLLVGLLEGALWTLHI
jgi:hypothetical protein